MKFNWINKGMNKVLNKESAPAYRLTPEWELYTSVVTTSLNNSFYEQEEERIERVRTLIGKCNRFVCGATGGVRKGNDEPAFHPFGDGGRTGAYPPGRQSGEAGNCPYRSACR